jgi:hypothetical protein
MNASMYHTLRAKGFGRGFILAVAASSIVGALTVSLVASAVESSTTKTTETVSPCKNECYYEFGECKKAAGDDVTKQNQCKTEGNTCLAKCPADGSAASSSDKEKAYQAAVHAAQARFQEGQKKLLEEYRAALEKAWAAKMK